jgi:hypothetical protein
VKNTKQLDYIGTARDLNIIPSQAGSHLIKGTEFQIIKYIIYIHPSYLYIHDTNNRHRWGHTNYHLIGDRMQGQDPQNYIKI